MQKNSWYVYRDKSTGKFVGIEAWESSHGKNGDYIRQRITKKEEEEEKENEPPVSTPKTIKEWEEAYDAYEENFPDDFFDEEIAGGADY